MLLKKMKFEEHPFKEHEDCWLINVFPKTFNEWLENRKGRNPMNRFKRL